ncbi:MAG: hypothetical protein KDJ52_08570 [Anaerolineae bacterium]|nr:hypothetical protein [Anaerolineae bacterium]
MASEPMLKKCFTVPEDDWQEVTALASRLDCSCSWLIRQGIKEVIRIGTESREALETRRAITEYSK